MRFYMHIAHCWVASAMSLKCQLFQVLLMQQTNA